MNYHLLQRPTLNVWKVDMIKLKSLTVSSVVMDELRSYQAEIDKLPYPEQIKSAKSGLSKLSPSTLDEIRTTLLQMSSKCHYCEDSRANEIEHFYPKSIYPNLTFEWGNYLFSCSICNRAKRHKFEIFDSIGKRHELKLNQPTHPPSGQPLLINPRFEEPKDFFSLSFASFELVIRDDLNGYDEQRADYTLKTLKLNDSGLVKSRKEAFDSFIGLTDTYYRLKQENNLLALEKLLETFRSHSHISVWQAMMSVKNMPNWENLKKNYQIYKEIDGIFTRTPDIFDII